MREARKGFAASLAAFAAWGLVPLYFKPLREVSAFQVVAHRAVWSCVLVLGCLALRGELKEVRAALVDRRVLIRLALAAVLISINWIVYVWAVAYDHVGDASLGYFNTPWVNVLLGVVVLSERLNRAQWTAVVLAVAGVTYLTVVTGHLPWISLTLGFSFACYGFIRKVVQVEARAGPFGAGNRCAPGRQWTGDGSHAVPVCLRRAPHPLLDRRHIAVHHAEF